MNPQTVKRVLKALESRRGFDGWWYSIDEAIRSEIEQTLRDIPDEGEPEIADKPSTTDQSKPR